MIMGPGKIQKQVYRIFKELKKQKKGVYPLKEPKVGRDCSCCYYARPVNCKEMAHDFKFCTNQDSEVFYQVLFEHFRCKKARKYDK